MEWLLIAGAFALSFGNGANDNFKGFATVWGSGTLGFRPALVLATVATLAGALASVFLAESLVHSFSGKGLVSAAVVGAPAFISSVAVGSAATILLATWIGFPVSTTHALVGGLVGAGFALGGEVSFSKLGVIYFLPLLVSPLASAALAAVLFRFLRRSTSPVADCACIVPPPIPIQIGTQLSVRTSSMQLPSVVVDTDASCDRLQPAARLSISRGLDRLHVFSAMAICFARGVNDTPKLAALLVAGELLDVRLSALAVAVAMMAGGWLFAARVAETMSHRIAQLDHPQGVAANLITALLVLFASKFGMPVSTTHVSVGAIAGVGSSANTLDRSMLRNVLLSWVATLPIAAIAAFTAASIL
ncbi:MAG: inorganic phosphate transporter [Steroidobacteraceae bacterium]